MSKIAHYLQEHLLGEVMVSVDARRYFSNDSSIFMIPPAIVVYPRNENDLRKTARFSWQLAERGRVIPITARGSGTDAGGAALGSGQMLVFPAHLNRILELDTKTGEVTVEPGINFGKLNQTLQTHGHFIPTYPSSLEYSTVGGAVANNAGGIKSVKYGLIGEYVESLRVVLANGEVILTERLSKRELSKKLGLATFEGEIYRAIDTLIEENRELVNSLKSRIVKSNAGYNLADVKDKDGSLDLTPLLVGSQGTLGIISEITLSSEPFNPEASLILAKFKGLDAFQAALLELKGMKELPSSLEMVNKDLLTEVHELNPNYLKEVIEQPFPDYVLLVEFDSSSERSQKKEIKQARKILDRYAYEIQIETEPERRQRLWKVRQSSANYLSHSDGHKFAVPLIDDGVVPVERINELIDGIHDIFRNVGLKSAPMWGHAGDGHLYVRPHLNLSQVGDRQRAFRLMNDFDNLVIKLGGSISAKHGDGRLKAPYLEVQYGSEVYALFGKIKKIFDPYGILNPGVKLGSSLEDIKKIVSGDYSFNHFYDHLPTY